jgi:fumarate hydratase class I
VLAKNQLFRTLDDVNENPVLAELEASVMAQANTIGVGPMGFGGKTSLIGCKITAANRLPASFFVSVAYDCWAYRRLGVRLDATSGAITKWLYRDPARRAEDDGGRGVPAIGPSCVAPPVTGNRFNR